MPDVGPEGFARSVHSEVMDARLAVFLLLHAMGSTAGLLFVFHLVRTGSGAVPSWPIRRDYALGGLFVVVGLGLRFLLVPTTVTPGALAALPAPLLRSLGLVFAIIGAMGCLWALWRLVARDE